MVRKLQRWLELSADERALLGRAAVLLPIAKLALVGLGFNRTQRVFQWVFATRSQALSQSDSRRCAEITMKVVRIAALHGACRANCLPRSLVAWALLRRRGLDPALRFGARRRAGEFEAHAWVELGPLKLDEYVENEERFVPFGATV